MANIKTAISIQKPLFDQIDALAHDLKISRSKLFTLALEKFLRDFNDSELFDSINKAYENEELLPDEAEQKRMKQMKRIHHHIIENEW